MDREIKTSFIPKQPAVKATPSVRRGGGGLFFIGSLFLLIVAGIFYGGAYGYLNLLNTQISRPCPSDDPKSLSGCGLDESIERVKNSIDQNLLIRFRRVDAKLAAADSLVSRHTTINGFLTDLSDNTLHVVRFTDFEFESEGVLMKGIAKGYEDIALQSEVLANDKTIKGFIFSDLNLDSNGDVTFSLSLSLEPGAISYNDYLNEISLGEI